MKNPPPERWHPTPQGSLSGLDPECPSCLGGVWSIISNGSLIPTPMSTWVPPMPGI